MRPVRIADLLDLLATGVLVAAVTLIALGVHASFVRDGAESPWLLTAIVFVGGAGVFWAWCRAVDRFIERLD